MIQLLVIFPIIYKLVEKNARLGIALSGALNLLFEISVKIFDMDKYYYRLSIGRYLLFDRIWMLPLFISGTQSEKVPAYQYVFDWAGIYCCCVRI